MREPDFVPLVAVNQPWQTARDGGSTANLAPVVALRVDGAELH
jgi:hypothetical protein